MVYLGLERGATGWQARMNPLSYGGTHSFIVAAAAVVFLFYRS